MTTGWGSAVYAGQVGPGDAVAVVGVGGLGSSAVQGARLAGAEKIFAIDPVAFKRDSAKGFGATHTAASVADAVELIREATAGRMCNQVISTMGVGRGAEVAGLLSLAAKRGKVVITNIHPWTEMEVSANFLELTLWEKQLIGSIFGSANPRYDIPQLARLYRGGPARPRRDGHPHLFAGRAEPGLRRTCVTARTSGGSLSLSEPSPERFEVSRQIAASPSTVFAVLSDPRGHVTIDSSGMLQSAEGNRVTAAGDEFVVHMDRESLNDYPMGKYDVTVIITRFEPDALIEWTISGQIQPPIRHLYGYRLEPSEIGTLVTSYYDWSEIAEPYRDAGIFPVIPDGPTGDARDSGADRRERLNDGLHAKRCARPARWFSCVHAIRCRQHII